MSSSPTPAPPTPLGPGVPVVLQRHLVEHATMTAAELDEILTALEQSPGTVNAEIVGDLVLHPQCSIEQLGRVLRAVDGQPVLAQAFTANSSFLRAIQAAASASPRRLCTDAPTAAALLRLVPDEHLHHLAPVLRHLPPPVFGPTMERLLGIPGGVQDIITTLRTASDPQISTCTPKLIEGLRESRLMGSRQAIARVREVLAEAPGSRRRA